MILFATISFIAGVLTVLAPCILPLLPIIIGGSVSSGSKRRAYTVIGSLIISVILFTLLIKVSSVFLDVPPEIWKYVSAGLLFLIGGAMLFPGVWDRIPYLNTLSVSSNKALGIGLQKKNLIGDIIMGASLGPVFSTCSPTYFVILATVLPANFGLGLLYLILYSLGLGVSLLAISIFGQKLADKLAITSDSRGWFKRGIGAVFILISIFIATGFDKTIETIVARNVFDITKVEQLLLKKHEPTPTIASVTSTGIQNMDSSSTDSTISQVDTKEVVVTGATPSKMPVTRKAKEYPSLGMYKEITNPAGFVNTDGKEIKLAEYVGKKIIVIDFLTYSCINCVRTFPYLNDWYAKYKDTGLVIVGIHTPEFAFERKQENVEKAMKDLGINFPVVLDNKYGTWNAYGNQYWPRKYIIDLKGNIVYDHIGEGNYKETEEVIQDLLMTVPGNTTISKMPVTTKKEETFGGVESRETYLGYARMDYHSTPISSTCNDMSCVIEGSKAPEKNTFSFLGTWKLTAQSALGEKGAKIIYHFKASKVHLVMGSTLGATIRVTLDDDIKTTKTIKVQEEKLYTIVDVGGVAQDTTVTIEIIEGSLDAYAFTFG
jgi:cytochrome c biogenesis protein CcdA/thiol-disulfide isomerase/thioredoxin